MTDLRFGPTPRLCLEKASEPYDMERYEDNVRMSLQDVTPRDIERLTRGSGNLKMDALSRKLCLIRRETTDLWSHLLVTPITDYIQSKLAIHLRDCNIHKQIEMFQAFYSLTYSRGMSGLIFENICHTHFKRQILIHYVPMVRLDGNDRRHQPKWHSSHHTIKPDGVGSEQLEDRRKNALNRLETLEVHPTNVLEYDDEALSLEEDIYYIPMKSNEVAFDSFICHDGHLYMFQFTVSDNHGINKGLISRFTQLVGCEQLPPHENWHFIFLIPDGGNTLKCPYPESPELQELEPCSSQVVMRNFTKLIALPQCMWDSPLSFKEEEDEQEDPPHKKSKQTEKHAE
jgi:hypothetical protein